MNIFYATDENYCIHTGVSITSLLENNRNQEKITIYIFLHQVLESSYKKLMSIEKQYKNVGFVPILSDDLMKWIEKERIVLPEYRGNITADFLLFIEKLLPIELQEVICIDSDTLVLGSLEELWQINMDEYVLAAVRDLVCKEKKNALYSKKILDQTYGSLRKMMYYNTGVVLFNLNKLRELQLTEKFIELLNQFSKEKFLPDQDIFNYAVEDKYVKNLPFRYNYWSDLPCRVLYRNAKTMGSYSNWNGFKKEGENIVILHFVLNPTAKKPWDIEASGKDKKKYLKYRALTPWKNEPLKNKFSNYKRRTAIKAWLVYILVWIAPRCVLDFYLKIRPFIRRFSKIGKKI